MIDFNDRFCSIDLRILFDDVEAMFDTEYLLAFIEGLLLQSLLDLTLLS